MVVCVRCNKEEASWKCSVCGRMIGIDCTRDIGGKIYCLDHVPGPFPVTKEPPKKKEYPGLVKAIWSVAFLLVGTGAMQYIVIKYAVGVPGVEFAGFTAILDLFQRLGLMIVGGLAAMLALLIIAYAALRRS